MSGSNEQKEPHWLVRMLNGSTVTARSYTSFVTQYLRAAERAVISLETFENDHSTHKKWYPEAFDRACPAIIMSAFAIEASLNEAMMDLKIEKDIRDCIERTNGLAKKIKLIAKFGGFEPMTSGQEPMSGSELLLSVRNELAHPKAEWSDENGARKKVARKIEAHRLPFSKFSKPTDPVFPVRCMSAGFARWALSTATDFTDELHRRASVVAKGQTG